MASHASSLESHSPAPRTAPVRAISVFDLDRTLTRRPTYGLFLIGAARARAPWRLALAPLLLPLALAYALKLLPRRRMKAAMHWAALGRRIDARTLARLADRFAARVVANGLYPEARACLAAERAAGRRIVLATAAPHHYASAIARRLGIADVVATKARWRRGALTPRIAGENCRGPEKLRRLVAHLDGLGVARGGAHVRFFSDDHSDLPCFEWSDEPCAVNPTRRLAAHAAARGWPVLDWRRGA
jgi:HAD superfamily hydrolase (TIGR01490 family)